MPLTISGFARCRFNRNALWKLLPARDHLNGDWEPALPLILGAWWTANDEEKRQRFEEHLRWRHTHGALDEVSQYVRGLSESDWHNVGD